MLATPLLERNVWFLALLVFAVLVVGFLASWLLASWFLGFLFPQFLNCLVSKFIGSTVSEIQNPFHIFGKIFVPYYQFSIACFQEDVDPIFMAFSKTN